MKHNIAYPPVPEETACIPDVLVGKCNNFLLIGDAIHRLFVELGQSEQIIPDDPFWMTETKIRGAMLTGFQYTVGLTNRQMFAAIRKREALDFTLIQPLNYPGLEPGS